MSRKQQLLKRHRRNKRIALLLGLVLLLLAGVLVAWWLPLLLAVAAWLAHEAWFADHLFYSPKDDYDYQLNADEQLSLQLVEGNLSLPGPLALGDNDTLILKVRIKSSWLGRLFDPGVRILGGMADCQDFERGVQGVRYLNLTGQQVALNESRLALEGRFCRLDPGVELFILRHPDYLAKRVLVVAPHADDAELAAFGLYSQAAQSWIVTLTAGEIEAEHYRQMGLDGVEAARLKGSLRAWDSISVPLWAGVPQERCVQLGYFCLQLAAMQAAPEQPVGSREADMLDTRPFRRFNQLGLASDANGIPSWQNLVQDLVELIEHIQPQVIVVPHPHFDPHPDHVCAQQAVLEALGKTGSQPESLLYYANHLHDNDRWPMGQAGSGVALPPQLAAQSPLRPWALTVLPQRQWHKAMSLGMMHDLQPPPPFKRKIRRLIQRCLAGRHWPAFGENEFFRKAVRQHELFWVDENPSKREEV
ncbi:MULTISPECIES: PIG-L deacetylase family protein [unclassified Pseudomonas]|uniref:PIG-L deacetylase family protein n=1 Tax=unclassified Pseudomonas TaxID=196821 RepID=UPI000CD26DDE|nr:MULTISPECIES: PIG-L family deacetylase [unclassified Pseudomonas]POA53422.1 PIG-L family deacetylase [Pseudomonas sp. FW507-12TSA]